MLAICVMSGSEKEEVVLYVCNDKTYWFVYFKLTFCLSVDDITPPCVSLFTISVTVLLLCLHIVCLLVRRFNLSNITLQHKYKKWMQKRITRYRIICILKNACDANLQIL